MSRGLQEQECRTAMIVMKGKEKTMTPDPSKTDSLNSSRTHARTHAYNHIIYLHFFILSNSLLVFHCIEIVFISKTVFQSPNLGWLY